MPPSPCGAEDDEEALGSTPLVFIVIPSGPPRTRGDRCDDVTKELIGTLIKADDGTEGIIRLGIEIEDVLHAPQEVGSYLAQAPLPLLPGLEAVFLSVRRTVSSLISSTTPNSTSLSARSCMVQSVRP
jgi:hypothetical protein